MVYDLSETVSQMTPIGADYTDSGMLITLLWQASISWQRMVCRRIFIFNFLFAGHLLYG
jgi:hypothetical protein